MPINDNWSTPMLETDTDVEQRARPRTPQSARRLRRMPVLAQIREDMQPIESGPASPMRETWDYGLDFWQRSVLFIEREQDRRSAGGRRRR